MDQIRINTTINNLPANGGIVYLDGEYVIDAPVIISKPNVTLCGQNRFATTIRLAGSVSVNCVIVSPDVSHSVELKHFNLKCNKANQTAGKGILFGAPNGRINDVHVQDSFEDGIVINGSATNLAYVYMDDVRVEGSGACGVKLGNYSCDSKLSKVVAGNNAQAGFYVESANNELIGIEAFGSGWGNVHFVGNPWGARLIGSFINDAQLHGVYIQPFAGKSADHIVISGNVLWRNSLGADEGYSGVFIDTANEIVNRITVTQNSIFSPATGYRMKHGVESSGAFGHNNSIVTSNNINVALDSVALHGIGHIVACNQ